uniref:hypothetical protein n=1 Tax=Alistipes sp. TaxID=1872444 RepID=UPI0040577FF8
MAVKSIITELSAQIERLMEEHRKLGALCEKLTAERDQLKVEKRDLEVRVRELDRELSKVQLSEGLAGGKADKEKARARVNRLMREVDKCIALLNKPQ